MPLVLAGATFLVILLLAGSVAVLVTRPRRADLAGRLEAIARTEDRMRPRVDAGLMRDAELSGVPILHRVLTRWPGSLRLRVFLDQAGWKIRPGKFLLLSAVAALGVDVALSFVLPLLLATLMGILAGAIPWGVAKWMRSRRFRAFQRQFPEAIDLLTRAVRSGHAITTGMEMVAHELVEPLAGEFRKAFDEQNLGLPLRDAMMHMIERVPLSDVRFFVSALLIQRDSGGNLGEILDNLGHVIRERFRIQGEVRVRTAQGRLTAGILISLPPILFILLSGLNREYAMLLVNDPLGRRLLSIAAVLQLIGGALLWKVVQIEI